MAAFNSLISSRMLDLLTKNSIYSTFLSSKRLFHKWQEFLFKRTNYCSTFLDAIPRSYTAQSLFLALGALVRPGVTFRCTAEILVTELKILGALLPILGAPTPKEYLTLQKKRFRLCVAIWAYDSSIEHSENK